MPAVTRASKWATAVLCLVALACVVPFVYAITHHDHYSRAPRALSVILFLVMPGACLLVLLIARYGNAAVKAKAALVFCSCAVALWGAETVLQLAARARGDGRAGPDKFAYLLSLREKGVDALPAVYPMDLLRQQMDGTLRSAFTDGGKELLPLGGVSGALTVLCNETGEFETFVADAHGMRNPPGTWDLPTIDVAAVGDSFTQGFCVCDKDYYVALIAERRPTVNLGMAGNGCLLNLAAILEYASRIKPKHVLWFYFEGNDLQNLDREKTSPLLMRYLHEPFTQGLAARQATIDRKCRAYIEEQIAERRRAGSQPAPDDRFLRKVAKLTALRRFLGLGFSQELSGDYELLARILGKANSTVASWGGRLHLVYLPWSARYGAGLLHSDSEYDKMAERVTATASQVGIPVINIHEAFLKHGKPLSLFVPDGHYTEEGHGVVAAVVLRVLASAD